MIRRHPVLFGFILFCIIVLGFFTFVFSLSLLSGGKRSLTLADKVGVIPVDGVISSSKAVVEQLESFGKDDGIKAIVLRIDSPGGGVVPSQEIYEAILEVKKKKRIVASMGSVAASGGYLIACAADKIVANPGTITGSISTVMHFAHAEELLKKIGLRASTIKSGKYKDIGSPVRDMTEDERVLLQDLVDDIYDQFLDVVVVNRKMPKDGVKKIADGRVFSGRQALKLGLVDFLGDQAYAVQVVAKMAGIKEKPDVVYPPKKKGSLLEFFLQETTSAVIAALRGDAPGFSGVHHLYLYQGQ